MNGASSGLLGSPPQGLACLGRLSVESFFSFLSRHSQDEEDILWRSRFVKIVVDVKVIGRVSLVEIRAANASNKVDLEFSVAANFHKYSNIAVVLVILEQMSSTWNVCRVVVADEEVDMVHRFQSVHHDGHRCVFVRVCLIRFVVSCCGRRASLHRLNQIAEACHQKVPVTQGEGVSLLALACLQP